MKFLRAILITFIVLISPVHAVGEPLRVGIESFDPPFVMQGANKEIFGFDVDMISALCKIMQRTCQFQIMRFDELINAVADKKIDVALSSITITAERAKIVDFSIPYLLSYSRFLTNQTSTINQPFSLTMLQGKKIGIEVGTIFAAQIADMGIKNPEVVYYPKDEELLEALRNGDIDYVLLDDPTAVYWAANSTGAFAVVGQPYMYGYGLGIAVNPEDKQLLNSINQALLQFQNTKEFKEDYSRYLDQF